MTIESTSAFDRVIDNLPNQPDILRFAKLQREAVDLSDCCAIITPLFGNGFDALDVIEQLEGKNFRGLLKVLAPVLSDRTVVLEELRAAAGLLEITIDLCENL